MGFSKLTNVMKDGNINTDALNAPPKYFIGIYRLQMELDETNYYKEVINVLLNDKRDKKKRSLTIVGEYITERNNMIMGVEIDSASVYGSKAFVSIAHSDVYENADIKQNDIIIIIEYEFDFLDFFDDLKDKMISNISNTDNLDRKNLNYLGFINTISRINDRHNLVNHVFSGIVTKVRNLKTNTMQKRIEAQDMIRILQHINVESKITSRHTSIHQSDFDYIMTGNTDESHKLGLDFKNDNNARFHAFKSGSFQIVQSKVYYSVINSIMTRIKTHNNFDNVMITTADNFKASMNSNKKRQIDYIIIYISDGVYILLIKPIAMLRNLGDYYFKEMGIDMYFTNHSFFTELSNKLLNYSSYYHGNKDDVQKLMNDIATKIDGYSYYTIGFVVSNPKYLSYGRKLYRTTNNGIKSLIIKMFKNSDTFVEGTFTDRTCSILSEPSNLLYLSMRAKSNVEVDEGYEEKFTDERLVQKFMYSIGEVREHNDEFIFIYNKKTYKLYLKNTDDPDADDFLTMVHPLFKHVFTKRLQDIKNIFINSLSLEHVIKTNYSNLRSTKYNPYEKSEEITLPITQLFQLIIGSVFILPIKDNLAQSNEINVSFDLSQQIWLSSAIVFKEQNLKTYHLLPYTENSQAVLLIDIRANYINRYFTNMILGDKNIIDYELFNLGNPIDVVIYRDDEYDVVLSFTDYGSDNVPKQPQVIQSSQTQQSQQSQQSSGTGTGTATKIKKYGANSLSVVKTIGGGIILPFVYTGKAAVIGGKGIKKAGNGIKYLSNLIHKHTNRYKARVYNKDLDYNKYVDSLSELMLLNKDIQIGRIEGGTRHKKTHYYGFGELQAIKYGKRFFGENVISDNDFKNNKKLKELLDKKIKNKTSIASAQGTSIIKKFDAHDYDDSDDDDYDDDWDDDDDF